MGVRDDRGRHRDLLQGLGHRAADHVPPRVAAELRRLGRAADVLRPARLPRGRPRPPWSRPVQPDVGRHDMDTTPPMPRPWSSTSTCTTPSTSGTPPEAARSPATSPARRRPGGQGGADRRGPAADAEDRRQPGRPAHRGVRRLPRGHRVSTGRSSSSTSPPARSTASTGRAPRSREGVIRNWWRQGMMGGAKAHYDGIKAFSETDFTEDLKAIDVPDPGDARRRRPGRADRRLGRAVDQAAQARDAQGLPGLPARHVHHARRRHQPGPARVHQGLTGSAGRGGDPRPGWTNGRSARPAAARSAAGRVVPAATLARQRVAGVLDQPRGPPGPAVLVLRADARSTAHPPPLPSRGDGVHGLAAAARAPQPARRRASRKSVVAGGERTAAARHLRGATAGARPPGPGLVDQRRSVDPVRLRAFDPSTGTWPTTSPSSPAYLEHRDLAERENRAERFFINLVLVRLLYAHALVAAPGSPWPGSRRRPDGSATPGGR